MILTLIALLTPVTFPAQTPCPPSSPQPETCADVLVEITNGDPMRVGQFGSNNQVLDQVPTEDRASAPWAGAVDTPWSYWMNPAHPQMSSYFSSLSDFCTGLCRQTFGESKVDLYPLVWPVGAPAPTALFRSVSTREWVVGTHTYRRINATLPSGAHITVFVPNVTIPEPPDNGDNYRGDLLLHLAPYQGTAYNVERKPRTWSGDPFQNGDTGYPYDAPNQSIEMFGMEIETSANPYFNRSPQVAWFRPGMIEYEAFTKGMTVAVYQESLGARPTLATLSQMAEFAAWVDGPDGPSTGSTKPYRKFVIGGSVNGFHAVLAATFMPHIFRGAIGIAPFIDWRRRWDWITCHYRLQEQLLGFYLGGYVKTYEYTSTEWTQFIDLLRGYTPLGQSIA